MHTSLGESIYSQSLIVKTMYNKTELDKLRDNIKEQIVDPGIKKLEASLTSLNSSVAVTVSSLNSAKGTLTDLQSSMDDEKAKLEILKRQVQGVYSEPSRTSKKKTIEKMVNGFKSLTNSAIGLSLDR